MIAATVNTVSTKHIRKVTNGRKFSIDVEAGLDSGFVSIASKLPSNDRLKVLVNKSWQGMKSGYSPTLCPAGVGGTYFMKDSFNNRIGVFKPHDEEMGCHNNPKGFTPLSDSFIDVSKTRGVQGGDAAFRECAAYVLDHENFSGVPATDLVACNYPCFHNSPTTTVSSFTEENLKIGSFQEFKEHDFDAEDISPSKASRFPVNEVHKIALLDIRLFNTDRHGGNILVRKVVSPHFQDVPKRDYSCAEETVTGERQTQFRLDFESDDEDYGSLGGSPYSSMSSSVSSPSEESFELIPIDHGYTLPRSISGYTDSWFEWLNWPQAKLPFSNETKQYIERLDVDNDIALLRQKFGDWIQPECYNVLRTTTMWLKKGAQHDLTPYELGVGMCRKRIDTPSALEDIIAEVESRNVENGEGKGEEMFLGGTTEFTDALAEEDYYSRMSAIMDRKILEIITNRTVVQAKKWNF